LFDKRLMRVLFISLSSDKYYFYIINTYFVILISNLLLSENESINFFAKVYLIKNILGKKILRSIYFFKT
jgi:hypothetical protein